ncbi:MAG: DNA-binding protein, partial [Prevotella pallens]
FDKLCEFMADGSTVSQADVAAVFYKFRTVLNLLCSQGNIVDAGPLGTFRPTFTAKAVEKEEDFKPATHIKKTMVLFRPSVDFRTLHDVEYFKIPAYDKTKGKKKPEGGGGSQPHP